jgi:hypothetical protein
MERYGGNWNVPHSSALHPFLALEELIISLTDEIICKEDKSVYTNYVKNNSNLKRDPLLRKHLGEISI